MQLEKQKTYLLLGSNLGDRKLYLNNALKLIAEEVGEIKLRSSTYETAAWGKTDQPGFLNIAVEVETNLAPLALLKTLLGIEEYLGRIREEKWGARLIDIDIILYGNEIVTLANELQIPHPEMQNRKFVMEPLAEIAPDLIHPVLQKSVSEILTTLTDTLPVSKI
ncbi:2-amino-4-hydroxy-6-hydroxymethyldihydropteridine diphosphokinase [Pedobacter frigiditerrae]|uniref:2-amino-4-hydroxy-6-hydroxymethyldihydropteridine pyrophosphokinase n=1 Tax=Pedobacter frigiditerrae TaxID=2530452 RepID=A0A4R0MXI0_9SPHI|nr:2-amino-4-hydroxy-6-hydroxymethyldihydropteridine diphosphokinase [Pedobacter frigiditerrae]TCC91991.1 2-amino-4-hydroxy-6-hydroxymethyldihydropteridine diphosphokinase [Pedobacter frigiditerrae]